MGTTLFDLPFSFWADYAQNMASGVEYDTAYGVGVTLGKASNAKTWEAGLLYQSIDKDALFGQFIDSDFGNGTTDSEGWVIKGGYAWVKNVTFNGTYFINTRNKDVGTGAGLRPTAARHQLQVLTGVGASRPGPLPRRREREPEPSPGLRATLSRTAGEGSGGGFS